MSHLLADISRVRGHHEPYVRILSLALECNVALNLLKCLSYVLEIMIKGWAEFRQDLDTYIYVHTNQSIFINMHYAKFWLSSDICPCCFNLLYLTVLFTVLYQDSYL